MAFLDVDFDRSIDPLYHHCSNEDHYDSHRWSVSSSADSTIYTPSAAPSSPSTSLNRFLHERDGPFFTTAMWTNDLESGPTGHNLPGNAARLASPTYTSTAGSSWGDQRETPPFASPELHALPHSHFYSQNDDTVPFAYGGNPPIERRDSHFGGGCVAMHDVQRTADEQSDCYDYDNEPAFYNTSYTSYPQEGFQPLTEDDSQFSTPYSGSTSDYHPQPHQLLPVPQHQLQHQHHELAVPVIRRRRAQSSRNNRSPASTARVSKRPSTSRRTSSSYQQSAEDTSGPSIGRAFPCPLAIYGCPSSFGSKNEWKRHVTTQHMRLGFWRCDLCTHERKPNDFNRKDLFTQHVRRMHPPVDPSHPKTETSSSPSSSSRPAKDQMVDDHHLQDAANRCYKPLRSPPEDCRCLFCDRVFHGHGAWDERMEHVGRHMESAKKEGDEPPVPSEWNVDEMAERWMLEEQILIFDGHRLVLEQ